MDIGKRGRQRNGARALVGTMSKGVHVRMDADLYDQLQEQCERTGNNGAEVARQIIEGHLRGDALRVDDMDARLERIENRLGDIDTKLNDMASTVLGHLVKLDGAVGVMVSALTRIDKAFRDSHERLAGAFRSLREVLTENGDER